jgi:hypothetical protein
MLVGGTYPHVGGERARALEARRVAEFGNNHSRGGVADSANGS